MKIEVEVTDNGRIRVIVPTASGRKYGPSMTPEEAVSFAVKLSNIAYPLTKAVKKYTEPSRPVYREPQFGTPYGYTPGHCAARGFTAADFILEDDFIYWRNK